MHLFYLHFRLYKIAPISTYRTCQNDNLNRLANILTCKRKNIINKYIHVFATRNLSGGRSIMAVTMSLSLI